MNGKTRNPLAFEDTGGFEGVYRARIPADADFCCDRQVCRRSNNLAGHAGQERAILQQGRSAIAGYDLVHWTTEIEVDEIRRNPVDDGFHRLSQSCGICSKELNTERSLLWLKLQITPRPLVSVQNTLSGDKLGR